MQADMVPLSLTYASCRYDRIEPLRSGEVRAEGIDLNVMVFPSGRQIFDRMVGGGEFDASELSASEFIAHAGRGNSPFVLGIITHRGDRLRKPEHNACGLVDNATRCPQGPHSQQLQQPLST